MHDAYEKNENLSNHWQTTIGAIRYFNEKWQLLINRCEEDCCRIVGRIDAIKLSKTGYAINIVCIWWGPQLY